MFLQSLTFSCGQTFLLKCYVRVVYFISKVFLAELAEFLLDQAENSSWDFAITWKTFGLKN